MLENGLFFALGLLCATLVALLVAPAIWRRAVHLTTKRIEDTVPLSLDEIQASKDQMRAGYAIEIRRLEVELEKVKEQAARNKIEFSQKRDELSLVQISEATTGNKLHELESESEKLGSNLKKRDERLAATESRLNMVEQALKEKTAAFEELETKFLGAIDEFDSQKIEMVARETRMDTVLDEASELKKTIKQLSAEKERSEKDIKSTIMAMDKTQTRNDELEAKLAQLTATLADVEGRLERRDADLKKLQKKSPSGTEPAQASQNAPDNELVRDRIIDLAARVTAMTASLEGPDSPINKSLKTKRKTPARKSTTKKKATGKKTGAKTSSDNGKDLADRIRSIQSASEKV